MAPFPLSDFLDSCFLTAKFTQIVQFRTTNFTSTSYFDSFNLRRMKRECSFYSNTVRNFSNSEGFADAATLTLNDYTFEDLNSLTRTLDNLNVYFKRVSRTKIRKMCTQIFSSNLL